MNWFNKPVQAMSADDVLASLIDNLPKGGRLDPYSETWLFVQQFAVAELQALRIKNDNAKLDDAATAEIRGQIKFAKKLLALHAKADKVALGKPTAF